MEHNSYCQQGRSQTKCDGGAIHFTSNNRGMKYLWIIPNIYHENSSMKIFNIS